MNSAELKTQRTVPEKEADVRVQPTKLSVLRLYYDLQDDFFHPFSFITSPLTHIQHISLMPVVNDEEERGGCKELNRGTRQSDSMWWKAASACREVTDSHTHLMPGENRVFVSLGLQPSLPGH